VTHNDIRGERRHAGRVAALGRNTIQVWTDIGHYHSEKDMTSHEIHNYGSVIKTDLLNNLALDAICPRQAGTKQRMLREVSQQKKKHYRVTLLRDISGSCES